MPKGSPPRDERFLELIKSMPEDGFIGYELPDPNARIRGLSQHPLQKVVRNYGDATGKKFHSFKWLNKVYVVRLPVPDDKARDMKVPTVGVYKEISHESNIQGDDADRDGAHSSEARDVRPPSSGSDNST